MTVTFATRPASAAPDGTDRFRLNRAGILNVWQYDDQEFAFAGGRMLLRGANGAGKSKTLEMLLPFALDGDKARITASAKHHTSLLWLMTDGYEGQARVGYIWVEFLRVAPDGAAEVFTCGVGIRASASARTATAWHFATSMRVGEELRLEDEAGPLSRARLEEAIGARGQVFDKSLAYKEHVGRALFGLDPTQYEEVLRLLYWLRQPQIGEEIEPAKLALQLSQALPQLEEQAVRSAGDTFEELTAFGEQIERRSAAAIALGSLAEAYVAYARAAAAERGRAVVDALRTERRARNELSRAQAEVARVESSGQEIEESRRRARAGAEDDDARLRALEASPAARDQRRLSDLADAADREQKVAARARSHVARLTESQRAREAGVARAAGDGQRQLEKYVAEVRELDRRGRESMPSSLLVVPPELDGVQLVEPDQAPVLVSALGRCTETVAATQVAVRSRIAAVTATRVAVREVEQKRARSAEAESRASQAEQRWEQARARRLAAQDEADAAATALIDALAGWAVAPHAPEVDLPSELTPAELDALPERAAASAREPLEILRADQQGAATRRDNAGVQVARLRLERAAVEAQRDPAPAPPLLERTVRPDGHALWQLVDFAPDLGAPERAGLEAALQSAGLLDAWVRPGGRLLGADDLDVVLAASAAGARSGGVARTLAEALNPDLPAGSDVTIEDVSRILSAIAVDAGDDDVAWVAVDGSWRLGPARGRATKPRAQYIGATARAQERNRRLAALDAAIQIALSDAEQAQVEFAGLGQAIAALEAWVRELPTGDRLRRAWAEARVLQEGEEREEIANREAQHEAHQSRAAAARAIEELDRLARAHGLPADQVALEATEERLRQLVADLGNVAGRVPALERDLIRWANDFMELRRQADALAGEEREANAAARRAQEVDAELEALRETADASVRELEQRVTVVRESRAAHRRAADDADAQLGAARQQLGAAQESVRSARERVADGAGRRSGVLGSYSALATPPGLLQAAADAAQDVGAVASASAVPVDEPVPAAIAKSAERLAALTDEEVIPLRNKVYAAHREASTGPAADHQPTVAPYEQWDLLAVIARDDGGEAAIAELAQRVAAAVERDRGLLTQRERQQFERHILGELGDAIRRCRRDADELVTAMNSLLAGVTTSQGIRVRLDWKLRDDVPQEVRAAVSLLAQPVGALLPEERATLRDVLHSLIEASRAQRPDLSYSEHLAAALDYRTWSEFTIRYTRPEKAGAWEKLHRRSPLSQGEQKVLCYLPLFAAAAAHFTSLAGAAPHAPRLVLLDDAFPKIDVRTHPLLFGLLVQLDLDFVITSERLWGDHETVPSLAIYEALRDPAARGVAQYEYRWDGRTLHSLG